MVNDNHPPKASRFFDGKLDKKMQEDLKLAVFASRTVDGYLRALRQLADFAQRRPNKITEAQLRAYSRRANRLCSTQSVTQNEPTNASY